MTATAVVVSENVAYAKQIRAAGKALQKDAKLQPYDPEWLARRGNYYTLITPDIAAQLLERNTENRKPKRRSIAQYARDMADGQWNPDASDLKISRDGTLIDGQNRLMACIEAGVPFPTLLRTGLDKEARDHVDQGVRRTGGDTFRMMGLVDPNNISAAINARERYERTIREYGGRQTANPRRVPMTHAELKSYLEAHPQVENMLNLASTMQREGPGVPRSIYVAALSMFAESSEKLAREFAQKFIDGESKGTGDPLLSLSRYLARAKSPTELRTKSRNRNQQHLGAFVKAWNAWVQSESLDRLHVSEHDRLEAPV